MTTTCRSPTECSGVAVVRHQKTQKRTFLIYGTYFHTQTQGKSQENTHPSFAVSTCSSIFTNKISSDATFGHVNTENRTSCQHS